jgi:3-oxoacyl-[acyl-carrier-protein] synthase-3
LLHKPGSELSDTGAGYEEMKDWVIKEHEMPLQTVILGTGSYLPGDVIPNSWFRDHTFYKPDGTRIEKPTQEIIDKLRDISGIVERRYLEEDLDAAEAGARAGRAALEDSGIDGEQLDGIIVAHNFGNIRKKGERSHLIPNLAALVKHRMGIQNHRAAAWDVLFGCPGWIQGMIQAHQAIQSGGGSTYLVIGVEIMSRVIDSYDLDNMLFGDGAGAAVVKGVDAENGTGMLSYGTYSHCGEEVDYLNMGCSYMPDSDDYLYTKMNGRQVYRYGVNTLPELVTDILGKAGVNLGEVDTFLFHQANEKMIVAIAEALFKKHGLSGDLDRLLPMNLQVTGNSSVATIPTLMDQIRKGVHPGRAISSGDALVMASVGAGMHVNGLVYRVPPEGTH